LALTPQRFEHIKTIDKQSLGVKIPPIELLLVTSLTVNEKKKTKRKIS